MNNDILLEIIDKTTLADPRSIKALKATNRAFNRAVRAWLGQLGRPTNAKIGVRALLVAKGHDLEYYGIIYMALIVLNDKDMAPIMALVYKYLCISWLFTKPHGPLSGRMWLLLAAHGDPIDRFRIYSHCSRNDIVINTSMAIIDCISSRYGKKYINKGIYMIYYIFWRFDISPKLTLCFLLAARSKTNRPVFNQLLAKLGPTINCEEIIDAKKYKRITTEAQLDRLANNANIGRLMATYWPI
jgi:hypothetical protein